eukprot:UN11891
MGLAQNWLHSINEPKEELLVNFLAGRLCLASVDANGWLCVTKPKHLSVEPVRGGPSKENNQHKKEKNPKKFFVRKKDAESINKKDEIP